MKLILSGNEPRQEYLFSILKQDVDIVGEIDFDHIDFVTKYAAAALSFATPREEWWGNYHMHPLIQRRRQKVLRQGLSAIDDRPDALLMWGSWFNPFSKSDGQSLPFFNYIDQSRSLEPLPEERPARFSRRKRSYVLQQDTYRDSSGIFCMSEWCRDQTLDAHPQLDPKKAITVGWGPCAVDLSSQDIAEDEREALVLHVSNDFYRKGVDYLIETAALVKKELPAARFVVIGRDASDLDVSSPGDVEFLGPVYGEELHSYFRKASVFFLPHRFDRSPHVLAEAMSAGLPIVTTAQGGPKEVTVSTGAGFAHDAGDTRAYADSLVKLLSDSSLRRDMGTTARDLMRSRYNWPTVARKMRAEITRVTGAD